MKPGIPGQGWVSPFVVNAEFCVALLRDRIERADFPVCDGRFPWLKMIPLKVLGFVWRAKQNKIASSEALQKGALYWNRPCMYHPGVNKQPRATEKFKEISDAYEADEDMYYDTAAYLVLHVLIVLSQYLSMEIMKSPQTDDPTQKNTLPIFKFLPLMIGYFSLSVLSGLSIYWFTNNVLSTAQQVWLRKLGGAKPVVDENAGGIISVWRAKRSSSQPSESSGARLKQLKEEEKRKSNKALPE
ncbi:inner membrane protein PPF-1, chloroplastic [Lactuca sativa]|uniref:inner membrane protein PPF-1, chloroplastic n=1 Tax=Lactuca sativa TaxID=4236 RepID=UPI0022AF660F|nr:inner membrane protein PPF-1, chloroplastic [Lactuca sativa]